MRRLQTLKPRVPAAPRRQPAEAQTLSEKRMAGRKLQRRRKAMWTANPHCEDCGRFVSYPHGFELDHRVPLHKGGADTEANSQLLCAPNGCHERKTAADLGHPRGVPQKFRN